MQTTNEGYFLTRNVIRVDIRKNKFLNFINIHKAIIITSLIFLSLITVEGILLNLFIKFLLII